MKHKVSKESALSCLCPECGENIALKPLDLVVGKRVRCQHCNGEALVEQEFDPMKGTHHWILESPGDELPAEPR